MKIKAYWKSINPFHPDISQLGYTKTVTVEDNVDLKELEQFAKEDSRNRFIFDKLEILKENEKTQDKLF